MITQQILIQSRIFGNDTITEIKGVRSPAKTTKPIPAYILGGGDRPPAPKPRLE